MEKVPKPVLTDSHPPWVSLSKSLLSASSKSRCGKMQTLLQSFKERQLKFRKGQFQTQG